MRTKWVIKFGSREDLGKRMSVYMRWRGSYEEERHWEQLGQLELRAPSTCGLQSCHLQGHQLLHQQQHHSCCSDHSLWGIPSPAPSWNWRNASVPGLQISASGWGAPRKAGVLGWPPKTCSDPQLIFLNFLLWQSIVSVFRTALSAVSVPALMIHPFKTSITISCLGVKQQKGIQGSKLSKGI